ncbi:MAG: cation:proton antiporter [Candidatus Omnitrophica bacterium]|nr:cation:proton antiporter [Candidatus Omnitrophota bacterium]
MEKFIFELGIILVGSAVLSCVMVLFKQPIIIAYIICGILAGPWGLGWIKNSGSIEAISHIGITLLLFLAGLCLHPQKLMELFKKTSLVTLGNSSASFFIAFAFALLFKYWLGYDVFEHNIDN